MRTLTVASLLMYIVSRSRDLLYRVRKEKKMKSIWKTRIFAIDKWKEEDGATAVEYGLLVGLIAVFLITAISQLGGSISQTFDEAACEVSGKTWNDTTKVCS